MHLLRGGGSYKICISLYDLCDQYLTHFTLYCCSPPMNRLSVIFERLAELKRCCGPMLAAYYNISCTLKRHAAMGSTLYMTMFIQEFSSLKIQGCIISEPRLFICYA